MSLLLLAACSPSPVEPPPIEAPTAEPEISPTTELRKALGRAAKGDEEACVAVALALRAAPEVDAAVKNGASDWATLQADAPGLLQSNGAIRVDYRELSLAVGPGPASTALVTVGGAYVDGCPDPDRLGRWMLRAPTVDKAPECMRELLIQQLDQAIIAHLDADCVCAVPAKDPTAALAAKVDALGLSATAERIRKWPESTSWKACEATPNSGD